MPNVIYPDKMGSPAPAVPVRDASGGKLPLPVIKGFVMVALDYARKRPGTTFQVQQDGWGYDRREIAPLFDYCPRNIILPYGFIF